MFLDEEKKNSIFHIKGYNKSTIDKEFISELKAIENKLAFHEEFGKTAEFFDEDGVVLLSIDVEQGAADDCLIFYFPLSDKTFKIFNEDFNFEVDEDE